MGRFESFKEYAVDCMRQAEDEQTPEEKAILLNMALAWVRLAQQSQAVSAQRASGTPLALPPPAQAAQPAA